MSGAITVRKCLALDEFHHCVELQREIWGEADLEVEPATMFVVTTLTGGQVLGAFDADKLVGYTLAVIGLHDAVPYLHSHMTGVHPDYRDRGVGRLLKLFQREDALSRGIRLIVWTFDPLEARNAHFNLNLLGAIARNYFPNLYGVTSSPLHRGLPTDRLLAEWHLESARVVAAVSNIEIVPTLPAAKITLPPELPEWQREGSAELATVQARVRQEFAHWLDKGYAAIGFSRKNNESVYLLAPWSEF
jgi:predicted GNAT superfamily acetyltransferase